MHACARECMPSGWHWRGRGGPAGWPYAPLSLNFSLNGQGSFACGSDLAGGLRVLPALSMRDTGEGCWGKSFSRENKSYSQNTTNQPVPHTHRHANMQTVWATNKDSLYYSLLNIFGVVYVCICVFVQCLVQKLYCYVNILHFDEVLLTPMGKIYSPGISGASVWQLLNK